MTPKSANQSLKTQDRKVACWGQKPIHQHTRLSILSLSFRSLPKAEFRRIILIKSTKMLTLLIHILWDLDIAISLQYATVTAPTAEK